MFRITIGLFFNDQTLRRLINSVLTEAGNRKLKSIALPALGTGILAFPAVVACRCVYEEIDKFSAGNKTTSVKEVRMVVFETDQATFNVNDCIE